MKPTPLLEEVRMNLEAAIHVSEHPPYILEETLELVNEAIRQIQGAREDAARMAGRVTLDTELLDLLAPKEASE
jgi:hypothetical protein